jgi:hypothetical protein
MTARDHATRLADLLRREHHAMADFILALADFDAQRLWLELGHASLFSFLRRELGLSAGAAQYRKTAAELAQRHPEIAAALRDGKLCLSSPQRPSKAQTITAAARREVWRRSNGACEWPLAAGGVCGSTRRLELDHVVPRALGGPSSADDLRVVCDVHNDLAAREVFGDEWMDRFTRRVRRLPGHPRVRRTGRGISLDPARDRHVADAPHRDGHGLVD